jgi:hypothetical protein
MAQPSSWLHDSSAESRDDGVLRAARTATHVLTELPAQSAGGAPAASRAQVRTHALGQGVVLEVSGLLGDVVEELDRAIQLALADRPRGVVCDLTAVAEGPEQGAIEALAKVGRHVRDWPGIPVAVACPDWRVREALRAHLLGRHLIVTDSVLGAVSAVLATPIPDVKWLRLAPHPTAPRSSRCFVSRTLPDWGLASVIPSAALVVSELVTNSTTHAGTDIDLSVECNQGALRLTVRDNSPALPRLRRTRLGQHGRGLTIVAGLSDAVGVLPTADGGKVVWAVLNSALQRPATSPCPPAPRPANTAPERRIVADAHRLTGLPCTPAPPRTQPTTGEETGSHQPIRRAHKRQFGTLS